MKASVICPTWNRRALIPLAVACFQSQDWTADKELIVLDDGDDPVEDLMKGPNILYARHRGEKLWIGKKRNLCCEMATGEVILHADDDDWYSSGRITDQVGRLIAHNKQMSGYHSVFYWSMTLGKAYRYEGPTDYSVGAAMCYTREFWKSHPFPNSVGESPIAGGAEDNHVVFQARDAGQLISVDAGQHMVVRAHPQTSSNPDRIGNNAWPEVSRELLPSAFFEAIGMTVSA